MSTKNTKLTSVKVNVELYTNFKIEAIKDEISFQDLVNKTLEFYITNSEIKKMFLNSLKK